ALHLVFRRLELWQEEYLLSRIYSPPEAWLSWHDSRPLDRPLRSLLHILMLGIRGLVLVPCGLFLPGAAPEPKAPQQGQQRKGSAIIATGVFVFVLLAADSLAAPTQARADKPETASQATTFRDAYELNEIGLSGAGGLDTVGASQNLFFDVPLTKIIRGAT